MAFGQQVATHQGAMPACKAVAGALREAPASPLWILRPSPCSAAPNAQRFWGERCDACLLDGHGLHDGGRRGPNRTQDAPSYDAHRRAATVALESWPLSRRSRRHIRRHTGPASECHRAQHGQGQVLNSYIFNPSVFTIRPTVCAVEFEGLIDLLHGLAAHCVGLRGCRKRRHSCSASTKMQPID